MVVVVQAAVIWNCTMFPVAQLLSGPVADPILFCTQFLVVTGAALVAAVLPVILVLPALSRISKLNAIAAPDVTEVGTTQALSTTKVLLAGTVKTLVVALTFRFIPVLFARHNTPAGTVGATPLAEPLKAVRVV